MHVRRFEELWNTIFMDKVGREMMWIGMFTSSMTQIEYASIHSIQQKVHCFSSCFFPWYARSWKSWLFHVEFVQHQIKNNWFVSTRNWRPSFTKTPSKLIVQFHDEFWFKNDSRWISRLKSTFKFISGDLKYKPSCDGTRPVLLSID